MASASSPSPEGPERPASRSPAAWWYRVTGPDGPVPGEKSTLSYYTLLVAVLFLLTIGLIMVFLGAVGDPRPARGERLYAF